MVRRAYAITLDIRSPDPPIPRCPDSPTPDLARSPDSGLLFSVSPCLRGRFWISDPPISFRILLSPMNRPLVLIILDGWGYAPPSSANAISLARKPNYDRLLTEYPNTLIHTRGRFVGLPQGQMGNSEVGHLNIGAGRVVYMDITKIDVMIENGDLFSNLVLLDAMKNARSGGGQLHFCGLLSDGGVHSQQNHLHALLLMAKQSGVDRSYVHCCMD